MTEFQAVDWEGRYRDGATGWERPGLNPAFLDWMEHGELTPCRILVPGGGRSSEPLAMAEHGFDVTVVDLAASAVAAQRARLEHLHVKATIEQANLLTWDPPAPFDAIYDQTCLCALPPAAVPEYVRRLHTWLRPDGRLFVLFMQTGTAGGPPFDCPLPAMQVLFDSADWQWPETLAQPVVHSPGRIEQPMILQRRS